MYLYFLKNSNLLHFQPNKNPLWFIVLISSLTLSSCTKVELYSDDNNFDNIPYYTDKIFSSRNVRFCKIPVPSGYSNQSQTHPSICYIKEKWNGYDHWLGTTPYPGGNPELENPCIYFANSVSGTLPNEYNGIDNNPIHDKPSALGSYNSDIDLIFYNNCLYSLVREVNNGKFRNEIKIQKSYDGTEWSSAIHLYSNFDCYGQLELSPSIIMYKDKFRIYHLNSTVGLLKNGGNCFSIEIMEGTNLDSPDFTWLKFGGFLNKDNVGIEPWHMDLFDYENKLYMVFCGRDVLNNKSALYTYLAVSEDYENFYIYSKPLIKDYNTYRPSAYIDDMGYFNLYFSIVGQNGIDRSDRSIGIARIEMATLLDRIKK